MYDLGINDFISQDTSPAELLIKTINAIKLTNLSTNALQDKDLLKIAHYALLILHYEYGKDSSIVEDKN